MRSRRARANLERFGGHRAAAGLSIDESKIEAFADDFAAHADAHLDPDELFEVVRVDAVVSAQDLTLGLAEELARLAPFGLGNPEPTLLVPATEAVAPATVGDGKHLRFRVRQHGRDAGTAIAFGQGTQIDRLSAAGRFDVAFRLKENHWNGTVAPQLVVRRVFDTPDGYEELRAASPSSGVGARAHGRRRRVGSSPSWRSTRRALGVVSCSSPSRSERCFSIGARRCTA